jgi:hypothetical protein
MKEEEKKEKKEKHDVYEQGEGCMIHYQQSEFMSEMSCTLYNSLALHQKKDLLSNPPPPNFLLPFPNTFAPAIPALLTFLFATGFGLFVWAAVSNFHFFSWGI